jgi:hypothetical protein
LTVQLSTNNSGVLREVNTGLAQPGDSTTKKVRKCLPPNKIVAVRPYCNNSGLAAEMKGTKPVLPPHPPSNKAKPSASKHFKRGICNQPPKKKQPHGCEAEILGHGRWGPVLPCCWTAPAYMWKVDAEHADVLTSATPVNPPCPKHLKKSCFKVNGTP